MTEVSRRVKMKTAPACWLQLDRRRYLLLKTLTQKIKTLMFLQFGALNRHVSHQWLSHACPVGALPWTHTQLCHLLVLLLLWLTRSMAPPFIAKFKKQQPCRNTGQDCCYFLYKTCQSPNKLHSWPETGSGQQQRLRLQTESWWFGHLDVRFLCLPWPCSAWCPWAICVPSVKNCCIRWSKWTLRFSRGGWLLWQAALTTSHLWMPWNRGTASLCTSPTPLTLPEPPTLRSTASVINASSCPTTSPWKAPPSTSMLPIASNWKRPSVTHLVRTALWCSGLLTQRRGDLWNFTYWAGEDRWRRRRWRSF